MRVTLERGQWGRGIAFSTAEGVGGAARLDPRGLTEEQLANLLGKSAREAIDSLAIANEAVNIPLDAAITFPGPIAEAYYWSDAAIVGIQGPVGSGKTTTKMKRKLRRAIMMPRSTADGWRRYKVLFTRETYRQLWSTTIPSYLEVYPRHLGQWSGGRGDPVTHRIQFEDDLGPVEFIAEFAAFGDNIVASMRGVQITDLDLNEADTMPNDILSVGIGRIDRFPARQHFAGLPDALRSYGQIDCDFNAPDEESWVFEMFHDEAKRDELLAALANGETSIQVQFFNQPGYGQPGCENLQNLSPDYYERQLIANRLIGRGDMNERLVFNRVTTMRVGDPVFLREFNPAIHVSREPLEPIRGQPLLLGLDQGLKGAAVVAQFQPPYFWRIYSELHFPKERLVAREFGRRLRAHLDEPRYAGLMVFGGWSDLAGEAGSGAAADENENWNRIVSVTADIRIRPQRIGANRIGPRLEAVRSGLEFLHGGAPGLLIDGKNCPLLRRAFEGRYVWTDEVDRHGDKRKIPDKRFTEANVMDALQYLMLSKHRGDGTSPITRKPDLASLDSPGSGPQRDFLKPKTGLQTKHDVLNPYGD